MANETKHTPGPWMVEMDEPFELGICAGKMLITSIPMDDCCPDLHEVDRANARLIASAPDMLEALKIADHALEVAGFQDVQPIRATVRAAIARAEVAA